MVIDLPDNIALDPIQDERLAVRQIQLSMLRIDAIDPEISGNKWFKLRYNIEAAVGAGADTLLTFGGAYSNHLAATAAAAQKAGLKAVGIVRGHHAQQQLTPTLRQCKSYGMALSFISRESYKEKRDEGFVAALKNEYPNAWIVPEGGDNEQGLLGAKDIAAYLPEDADIATVAIGTGTTFCGIANGLPEDKKIIGFPAIKDSDYLKGIFAEKIPPSVNWHLEQAYHFGGFAKKNEALITFVNQFYLQHHIPLDHVYTAKMMYGIFDMVQQEKLPEKTKMVAIHTGGLQGNTSIKNKLVFPVCG
ncbi:MAG: pyridoxal-phosphate dependent enzyme [Edaphocola sp.]